MKLTGQNVEQKPNDRIAINVTLNDKWRKPVQYKLVQSDIQDGVLIEGDKKETLDLINCIAEVAWNNGWRPLGLGIAVENIVKNHKIPRI